MKFIAVLLLCSSTALAAKPTTITGLRAKALIFAAIDLDLGSYVGLSEANVDLEGVVSEKLGDADGRYAGERLTVAGDTIGEQIDIKMEVLEIEAMGDELRRLQSEHLEAFRLALEDVIKPVITRKPIYNKKTTANALKCRATNMEHGHDGVDIEPSYICEIK